MLHMADAWQRLGRLGIVIALVGVGASSPLAQTITNGDTLRQGGVTYRLWGIDSPELAQTCLDGWPAGSLAATRLQALTAGRPVSARRRIATDTTASSPSADRRGSRGHHGA